MAIFAEKRSMPVMGKKKVIGIITENKDGRKFYLIKVLVDATRGCRFDAKSWCSLQKRRELFDILRPWMQ